MKIRRFVGIVLVLLLLAPAALAEERVLENNTYRTGLPIVKDPITLTIATVKNASDLSDSQNEKAAFRNILEETGIEIEWIELIAGTQAERVNLMLSGADMPDIFYGLLNTSLITQSTGVLLPLEDLLETWAPNVVRDYAQVDGAYEKITAPDGHIYALMGHYESLLENTCGGIQMINKAWLDAVGKPIPTTLEEYRDVLMAFKTQDPNQNGENDEIPITFAWNIGLGMGAWGFTENYRVEDGVVLPTMNTPEYREYLEFYHALMADGLIDMESFSQTWAQYASKIQMGKVGSIYGWTMLQFLDADAAADWVVLPPFGAHKDIHPVVSGVQDKFTGDVAVFAISRSCEYPEAALRLWDYLSRDTESKLTVALGEKGILWDAYPDGSGYYFKVPEEATAEFTFENMKYTYGNVNFAPLILLEETPKNDASISPEAALRDSMVLEVYDYMLPGDESMPIRYVSPEKLEERTFIETDLLAHINQFQANSIMNGVTDESWNEYVSRLEDLRYSQWIAWYQDFYDGVL